MAVPLYADRLLRCAHRILTATYSRHETMSPSRRRWKRGKRASVRGTTERQSAFTAYRMSGKSSYYPLVLPVPRGRARPTRLLVGTELSGAVGTPFYDNQVLRVYLSRSRTCSFCITPLTGTWSRVACHEQWSPSRSDANAEQTLIACSHNPHWAIRLAFGSW